MWKDEGAGERVFHGGGRSTLGYTHGVLVALLPAGRGTRTRAVLGVRNARAGLEIMI